MQMLSAFQVYLNMTLISKVYGLQANPKLCLHSQGRFIPLSASFTDSIDDIKTNNKIKKNKKQNEKPTLENDKV